MLIIGNSVKSRLTRIVIRNNVENMDTKMWKKIFPKMKVKQLLPKDIDHLESLERGEGPTVEEFEKLIDRAIHTPPFKLKSSRASRKRSGRAKDQSL